MDTSSTHVSTSEATPVSPLVWFISTSILVVADVASRAACFSYCNFTLTKYIGLHPFKNEYFAFSIPLPLWCMYMLYGLVMTVLVWYVTRQWLKLGVYMRMAWLLIVAGAVVNVGERLAIGYVRDFIQVGTGYLNLGDIYILVGVAYLLYHNSRHAQRTV